MPQQSRKHFPSHLIDSTKFMERVERADGTAEIIINDEYILEIIGIYRERAVSLGRSKRAIENAVVSAKMAAWNSFKVGGPEGATNVITWSLVAHQEIVTIKNVDKEKSIQEKLKIIDAYAASHPGQPVSDFILKHNLLIETVNVINIQQKKSISEKLTADDDDKLKEIVAGENASRIPDKAPVLWTGNHRPDDTPATFIMREYAQYMGKGLTTGAIRKLDPTLASLYSAWRNPKKGPAPELPAGFNLPSKRQAIDQRDQYLTPGIGSYAGKIAGRSHRKAQRE